MGVQARWIGPGGEVLESIDLAYAGQVSHFEGRLPAAPAGENRLEVIAFQPEERNFGRAVREVVVSGR